MYERTWKLFLETFEQFKHGKFFEEGINTNFDYLLKTIWQSDYQPLAKTKILKTLAPFYSQTKTMERPAPFFYILISLKDEEINHKLQQLILEDFIKSNASENSVFQILNFLETFAEKQTPIKDFLHQIINSFSLTMNKEMLEALSNMLGFRHPETIKPLIKKFLEMSKTTPELLKEFIKTQGKSAMLEAINQANPEELNRLFKNDVVKKEQNKLI